MNKKTLLLAIARFLDRIVQRLRAHARKPARPRKAKVAA